VSTDHYPEAVNEQIEKVQKHFAQYWSSLRRL
jgi:hypothetical protein